MFGKKGMSGAKGDTTTYIGRGMKIEGKLRCSGPIRIDGEIRGEINCEGEVTIGPSAFIEATIHAAKIAVNGKIEGNLFTSDQLEILAEGHIVGNVSNPPGQLIIHEGAVIEGQCFTYDPEKVASPGILEAPKTNVKKIEKNKKLPQAKENGAKTKVG